MAAEFISCFKVYLKVIFKKITAKSSIYLFELNIFCTPEIRQSLNNIKIYLNIFFANTFIC